MYQPGVTGISVSVVVVDVNEHAPVIGVDIFTDVVETFVNEHL